MQVLCYLDDKINPTPETITATKEDKKDGSVQLFGKMKFIDDVASTRN